MKYTGRIGGILFIIINSLLGFAIQDIDITGKNILIIFGNFILCWWLGKKYDEAKFFSEKDSLTEAYNRRFVIKKFPKLLAKANKKKETLIVFIVDIDNFKDINDTQGHEFGDSVIQCISRALTNNIRKEDFLARWGGDEFLIIMWKNDKMCPDILLERVKDSLEDASEQFGTPLSVSIGKSVYPDNGSNLVELIKFADKRMYEQKIEKKETGYS